MTTKLFQEIDRVYTLEFSGVDKEYQTRKYLQANDRHMQGVEKTDVQMLESKIVLSVVFHTAEQCNQFLVATGIIQVEKDDHPLTNEASEL